jgi:hypothetical protein
MTAQEIAADLVGELTTALGAGRMAWGQLPEIDIMLFFRADLPEDEVIFHVDVQGDEEGYDVIVRRGGGV